LYILVTTHGRKKPLCGIAGLWASLTLFALLILVYNATIFGGPLTTGYSPRHGWVPWPAFSWDYFLGTSPIQNGGYRAIFSTLWKNFHLGLFLTPVGLAVMPRSKALLIGGNIVTVCGMYAFYVWSPTGLGARFLLFAFPMLCLSIAFTVVHFLGLLVGDRHPQLLGAIVLTVALLWQIPNFSTSHQAILNRNAHGRAVVSLVRELTRETEPDAVFVSHTYHDMIIFYGNRSALYYAMLAKPDPISHSYQVAEYESRLVTVVNTLLDAQVPIYLIKEPEHLTLKQGPAIDPYPILARQFELVFIRDTPPVYKVTPSTAP
jgi:hypothetical protein